jgi:HEAT repeat protein
MRSASTAKRAKRMLGLAKLDSSDAVGAFTEALADPDLEVRATAAIALASLRDPASTAALAGIVAGWEDPRLARSRRAALHTLVAFRTRAAAVELARALASVRTASPPDLDERSALLAVVYAEPAGMAAPLVVRALESLLAADDEPVADRAAALLMLFPAESNGPVARTLRTAAAPSVRRRAAQALSACRQDVAIAALVEALKDRAPGVRAAAASSLGEVRDSATAGPLQAASADGDAGAGAGDRAAPRSPQVAPRWFRVRGAHLDAARGSPRGPLRWRSTCQPAGKPLRVRCN